MLLYEMLIAIGAVVLVVAAIDRLAARVMMGPDDVALLRLARAATAERHLVASAAQHEREARAAAAQRRLVASAAQHEREARAAQRRLVAYWTHALAAPLPARFARLIIQLETQDVSARFTICQALAFLQGRISQGWDKSNCPCNCGIGIAVKRSLPRSPKLHTKRRRRQSILHFLDVLASGNSYRAMRPHGTDACGLCLKSVHQFGFRCAWFDASASNVWPSIVSCLSLLKASPPVGTVVASAQ